MKSYLLIALVALNANAANWGIDDSHSSARFKIRHLGVSNVSGEIAEFKGHVEVDDKTQDLKGIDATIGMGTINTNNAKRDAHLKAADFFDVEKHPTAAFKSKTVTKGKDGKYTVVGELTMKGVTKPLTFKNVEITAPAKDPWGGVRRGLVATTKLNRKDWGVTWNKTLETGGFVLGDEVTTEVEAELLAPKTEEKKS